MRMTLLRFVFGLQLCLVMAVAIRFLITRPDFSTLGLFIYGSLFCFAIALYAGYQAIRHPPRRRLAAMTIATPLIGFTLPFLIQRLVGGPVAPGTAAIAALIAGGVGLIVVINRSGFREAGKGFRRPGVNGLLTAVMIGILALLWLPIGYLVSSAGEVSLPLAAHYSDAGLAAASKFFLITSVLAAITGVGALLYAPVGLIRNTGARIVHVAQLVLALALLATVGLIAFVAALAVSNPG